MPTSSTNPTPSPKSVEGGAPPVPTENSDPTQTPTIVKDGVEVNPAVPEPLPKPVAVPEFISEGTAKEIEMHGRSVDPRTGLLLDESALPEGR